MFRSLWFRLIGTVVGLVIFTLALSLIATLVIAGRQFSEFITNTSNEIISISGPPGFFEEQANNDTTTEDSTIGINPDPQGGGEINRNGSGIIINPDGGIQINQGEQPFDQIEVQIPEIVTEQSNKLAAEVGTTLLVAASTSGFLAIIAGVWLSWQITRPLARLRNAAEQFATGKLDIRVQVKSKDEVGRVGMAFNHMAGELQRQEGLRKQMVADIAHELRTPLTVMQVNLEAMKDELLPTSPDELDGLHHEVTRLSRLVEDLRLLSLADSGNLELHNESIDANTLVETAVRRLKPQAETQGIHLEANLSKKPVTITGDEDKLHQVLANLISNSLRFTPSGKRVDISVRSDRKWVIMQVSDEGPGINPADLPILFERFFKGDRARSRGDSGSGLGLSIVKQLVELHGGQIDAALPKSGGLQVTIQLPLAE
jgi:signal transduction histidine kinase